MTYELEGEEYPIYQGIIINGIVHALHPLTKPDNAIVKYSMAPVPWKILPGMCAPEGISFDFIVHTKTPELLANGNFIAGYSNSIEPLLTFERIR